MRPALATSQEPSAAPGIGARPGIPAKPKPAAPSAKPGFKLNEYIVYPAHGVGQIVGVETQEVAGFSLELFVVSFIKDKMTLKVPTSKVVSVGMRKLADTAVVDRALQTLSGRARVKRTMWSRRAQEYEAKINSGDLITIAEVVRDLYRSDTQPEQSYSERQLYEAALDRMAREVAAVRKLIDSESLKLIESFLLKGPRRGPKAEGDAGDDGGDEADVDRAARALRHMNHVIERSVQNQMLEQVLIEKVCQLFGTCSNQAKNPGSHFRGFFLHSCRLIGRRRLLHPRQRAPQLDQRATFDLPHPLLGNAKAVAQRLQRHQIFRQPTLAHDAQLAFGENRQRILEPARAPIRIQSLLDDLVGERLLVDKKIHPLRGAGCIVVDELGVQRNVGTR